MYGVRYCRKEISVAVKMVEWKMRLALNIDSVLPRQVTSNAKRIVYGLALVDIRGWLNSAPVKEYVDGR
jgi:hypothetical protein